MLLLQPDGTLQPSGRLCYSLTYFGTANGMCARAHRVRCTLDGKDSPDLSPHQAHLQAESSTRARVCQWRPSAHQGLHVLPQGGQGKKSRIVVSRPRGGLPRKSAVAVSDQARCSGESRRRPGQGSRPFALLVHAPSRLTGRLYHSGSQGRNQAVGWSATRHLSPIGCAGRPTAVESRTAGPTSALADAGPRAAPPSRPTCCTQGPTCRMEGPHEGARPALAGERLRSAQPYGVTPALSPLPGTTWAMARRGGRVG